MTNQILAQLKEAEESLKIADVVDIDFQAVQEALEEQTEATVEAIKELEAGTRSSAAAVQII